MNTEMLQPIENLLNEWRKATYYRNYSSVESGDAEADSMVHAISQGEAKAYLVAVNDVEQVLNQASGDDIHDLQKLSNTWLSAPDQHLGYSNVGDEMRLPTEEVESEHAVSTLKKCAHQLRLVLENYEPSTE